MAIDAPAMGANNSGFFSLIKMICFYQYHLVFSMLYLYPPFGPPP
jgi:hypothetical protein